MEEIDDIEVELMGGDVDPGNDDPVGVSYQRDVASDDVPYDLSGGEFQAGNVDMLSNYRGG